MRTISTLLACCLLLPAIHGQKKTYLTVEAGPHRSLMKISDPGNLFRSTQVGSTISGLLLEQEVSRNVSVSTGLYYQPFKAGLRMDDNRGNQSRHAAFNTFMIPFRVQYRIQPTEFPVTFHPRVGYIHCRYSLPETPFDNRSVLSSPEGTAYSYTHLQSGETPAGHLLEAGVSVGLLFSGPWKASVSLSYVTGVLGRDVTSSTLDYTDLQGNSFQAEYTTRGNGLFGTLAFHVPVSNIWQNRDYRIRSRIEGSTFDGKPLERKGQFYAGLEGGSLWRLFYSSRPALAARPLEGRGFLRYANFHGGIYVGYMLSDELGLDLGVNYQRSSTFYSLMYDHEADFAGKAAAPLYLEVPFRVRYFYPLMEEKLFMAVYGGASLLTHFSGDSYEGPGGAFSYRDPSTQSEVPATASSRVERLSAFRPVLRVGAGAEYLLPVKLPLFVTAYVNYMQGFISAEQVLVTTSLDEQPPAATLLYNGNGWSVDVGVKLPISFRGHNNCVNIPVRGERGGNRSGRGDR